MPRVNLIGWDNGVGLSRDLRLIEHALREAGLQVHLQPASRHGVDPVGVLLGHFVEDVGARPGRLHADDERALGQDRRCGESAGGGAAGVTPRHGCRGAPRPL